MPSQEEEQGHQGNDFASRGVAAASSPGPSRRSPGERGEERAPLAAELRHACAARELATLALTFSEDGNQPEAAGLFAHSLTILEAAFGSAQPELAAFKSEVQRVVDSGAASLVANGADARNGCGHV